MTSDAHTAISSTLRIRPPTIAQKANRLQSRRGTAFGMSGTERADKSATCRRWMMRSAANANTAGISSTNPTTAPIPKFCWPITCL